MPSANVMVRLCLNSTKEIEQAHGHSRGSISPEVWQKMLLNEDEVLPIGGGVAYASWLGCDVEFGRRS